MIPLKDENPTIHKPVLTVLLIAVNVFIYFFVQPHGQSGVASSQIREARFTYEHAAIPKEVTQGHPLTCGPRRLPGLALGGRLVAGGGPRPAEQQQPVDQVDRGAGVRHPDMDVQRKGRLAPGQGPHGAMDDLIATGR